MSLPTAPLSQDTLSKSVCAFSQLVTREGPPTYGLWPLDWEYKHVHVLPGLAPLWFDPPQNIRSGAGLYTRTVSVVRVDPGLLLLDWL